MVFHKQYIYLLFALMISQKCIGTQEVARDNRVLVIPDIYLMKLTPNSYELLLEPINGLMLYARSHLKHNQCMGVYLDAYNFPKKAGFMAIFQAVSTPEKKKVQCSKRQ
ncbi:MAG: hypothetical protein ACR2PT_01400 [Endozoicomonas sp.]